jgi:hypothetical protein
MMTDDDEIAGLPTMAVGVNISGGVGVCGMRVNCVNLGLKQCAWMGKRGGDGC